MAKINDGGPAFPRPHEGCNAQDGMSLRDWFAGMAIQSCINNYWSEQCAADDAAMAAYQIADAMLKAREVKE
jgi:hypothetical protein